MRYDGLKFGEDGTYLLQDRDGDYVRRVTGSEYETVKVWFDFTKNKSQAKRFTYEDLWSKRATMSIGGEFVKGYAGGRAIRV